jgi:hypothetical protein
VKRVLTALFAYACAAIAPTAIFLLFSWISEGQPAPIQNETDVRIILAIILGAAVYALPIALPVIIATEIRRYGDWKIFAGAGAILGGVLAFLFAEIPFDWSNLRSTAPLVPITIFAALVYWAVAWKWMPPKASASSAVAGMPE